MRHANSESSDLPGQDSFLDIVANIVGILILLVMVVGLRAANSERENVAEATQLPQATHESAETALTKDDLEQAVKQVLNTRREVVSKVRKTLATKEEVAFRDATRVELATFVAALEEELAEKRQHMNADEQRSFDLRKKLGAAQQKLDDLTLEQIAVISQEPEVKVIEALPTPLASAVKGEELHVRLANGKAKLVPHDRLFSILENDFKDNLWRLDRQTTATRIVGPVDGFRLRYTMRKTEVSRLGGQRQLMYNVALFEILPERPDMGEQIGETLTDDSDLLSSIASISRGRPVPVTIWTYTDSFEEFRIIKKALYEREYAVACRPLQIGRLITGSPNGTKSAAQ